jgi:hypothetical protein
MNTATKKVDMEFNGQRVLGGNGNQFSILRLLQTTLIIIFFKTPTIEVQ